MQKLEKMSIFAGNEPCVLQENRTSLICDTRFFYKLHIFSIQPQCCLTF